MTRFLILMSMCGFFMLSSQEIKAQENVTIADSIDAVVNKHLEETVFYKKDAIKIDEKDLLNAIDNLPSFGVFKDTYFTTGIPLHGSINKKTADAHFQFSIRQRLTKSRLPFNTYLMLNYTQKSFWDIYAKSSPFKDNNYNIGVGVGKVIIHNGAVRGGAFLQVEHESNGRDGDESRSWNMISLAGRYNYNVQLVFGFKVWIPFVDGEQNEDLLDYRGLGTVTANYLSKNKRWWLTTEFTPRKGWGNLNSLVTVSYKLHPKHNQFLYLRFYDGMGESLLDYNRYEINLRVGFCIKPDFRNLF